MEHQLIHATVPCICLRACLPPQPPPPPPPPPPPRSVPRHLHRSGGRLGRARGGRVCRRLRRPRNPCRCGGWAAGASWRSLPAPATASQLPLHAAFIAPAPACPPACPPACSAGYPADDDGGRDLRCACRHRRRLAGCHACLHRRVPHLEVCVSVLWWWCLVCLCVAGSRREGA